MIQHFGLFGNVILTPIGFNTLDGSGKASEKVTPVLGQNMSVEHQKR